MEHQKPSQHQHSVIGVLISVTLILAFALLGSQRQASNVWFDDVQTPIELSTQNAEALVRAIGETLARGTSIPKEIPFSLRNDDLARIVLLSVSDGQSHAQVAIGAALGLVPAVEQAIATMQATLPLEFYPRWIKVDIVQTVYPVQEVYPGTDLVFERSLKGLAFERPPGIAFLPEELVAHTLVDSDGNVRVNNIVKYLSMRRPQIEQSMPFSRSEPYRVRRFTTSSYFYDGKQVFPLYRGHRLFTRVSSEDLLNAARLAGEYLIRSVNPDGSFVYVYLPKSNQAPDRYNLVRHAGTVYAMLELYKVIQERRLLEASHQALKYLLQFAKPWDGNTYSATIVNAEGEIKLGATALTVIALAKYTEVTQDEQYMPLLQQLGRYIQQSQLENGKFISKRLYPSGQVSDFDSQYYPGEALLALVRLYALDHQESWLDAAEKGSQYLINVRDRGKATPELPHDHWLLYALNELYRYRPNPLYLEHALRVAQAISQSQNRTPSYIDYLGSYYVPPRSTPTATRTEGLVAAYKLARDFGRAEEALSIPETICLNIKFQLQTQFRPEKVLYIEEPQQALGGFHKSLTNFKIRIDYVQHNILALLGTYELLERTQRGEFQSGECGIRGSL